MDKTLNVSLNQKEYRYSPKQDKTYLSKEDMMKTHSETNEISRIEKRAIEASAVAPIIQAVAKRIGKEKALAILQEVNEKEAFQRGESIRNKLGNTGIPELVEDVATWGIGGVLEMEVLEQTSVTYHFNITRCPYFEKYHELGLTEYGVALSCCRDEPFARGFHPQLKLERSKTIMEGADYCDFRYSLRSS
jgi:hypothetical protein